MDSEEDEEDIIVDVPFVGRTSYLNLLAKAWERHRIIGIYGLRAIGKSRTVKEFLKKKSALIQQDNLANEFTRIEKVIVDMKYMRDIHTLHANLCASLGVEPIEELDESKYTNRWKRQIFETISNQKNILHIILFDNAEDVMDGPLKDEFLSLISRHLVTLKNVKVLITSTTKMMLAERQRTYFSHELKPMPDYEASELLEQVAPDIDFGEFKDSIIRLSEGLPLVILMVGSELTSEEGLIQPKDMVEFLTDCRLQALSRENYPQDDRVAEVYTRFINRLSEPFRQRLAVLGYIPGSFDAEEARSMLAHETVAVAKAESLIYYRGRSMISHDPTTSRFNIQGILRECLDVYFTIKDLPEIRRRYCETFVKVMKTLCAQLGTEEFSKALSQFSQEQPNLQKLLTEVYNSTEETYPFFIKVAADCTELIDRFMSKESEKFYDGLLKVATTFGQERDMAIVYIAIGSLFTNAKGDFASGGDSYVKALDLLRNSDRTLLKATLHQRLGYNLYTRGLYDMAIKHLKEAFDIHLFLKTDRTLLAFQTFSSLGIVYNATGNFKEAERYFFESLRRREITQGKDHYRVGATKNNIGLMYDLMGEHEKALKYYTEGLEIKKKTPAPTWSLVYSISNIANIYRSMNNCPKAIALLEEAMQKLNKEEFPHKGAVSLTYDTLGKVYQTQGKFHEAVNMFAKAADIRKEISENGVPHVESLMHLAKAQNGLGNHETAIRLSEKILILMDKTNKDMPTNSFISECLEALVESYRALGMKDRVKTTLEMLQSELMRQERVHMGYCNTNQVDKITAKLSNIYLSLKQL